LNIIGGRIQTMCAMPTPTRDDLDPIFAVDC
jgi:hypothetical protein